MYYHKRATGFSIVGLVVGAPDETIYLSIDFFFVVVSNEI